MGCVLQWLHLGALRPVGVDLRICAKLKRASDQTKVLNVTEGPNTQYLRLVARETIKVR